MKSIIATSLSVLFAAVALSSCTSVADLDVVTEASVSAMHAAQVTGTIPGTRANAGSVKSEWTSEDWIYTYNNGKHSYFRANESGSDASFTISGSNGEWSDGVAYAAYPKSVKFTDGSYTMSFGGQTGLLEDVQRFNLMTSKANVVNGKASFNFTSHVSVLAIPATEIMYSGTSATKVVVSGENFSSVINVSIESGDVKVSTDGNSDLTVNNPTIDNGYIFVALVPAAGELSVDLYDNIGGHFFTSINGGSLSAGSISDLSDASWDGGIEISFNPTVGDWE